MPTPAYYNATDLLKGVNIGSLKGSNPNPITIQPVNPPNQMYAMSNATATTNDSNPYYNDFANQINNQYNGAIGSIDKLQEQDKKIIGQQHDQYRSQASVNAARNQMALKEQMAQQGLYRSGDNITASTQINNQRSADINQANMNESNAYGKLTQEKYRQMMEYEMQRQNALRDALTRSKEWQYRDNRDKITDDRWKKEWDYNIGRDKISDDRWKQEWDYNLGRDKIEDGRWQKEWDYNIGRDGIEDGRYKTEWEYKKQQDALNQSNWERQFAKIGSSRGGGSYSSSSAGSTKDNVWSEFSQQFNGSSPSNAAQWLGKNQSDIVDAVGQTEYNKMKEVAYQQQRNYNTDQKRKRENKYQSY